MDDIILMREFAKGKNKNLGFIFSCGHTVVEDKKLPKTAYYKRSGICDKCSKWKKDHKAGRERMGWFVGSDKAEYAWDKKRNEAAKKKEMDEMSAGIKVGDIVTVSALPSCREEIRPKLPAKGKIVDILMYPFPYPHISVEIDGKRYSVDREMLILA